MQKTGVVALFRGWRTEGLEPLPGIMGGVEAGAPALIAGGRIGDDVVEGLEQIAIEEFWTGEGVAGFDDGGGVVVQHHVHAGETGGGGVLFLPVEGDFGGSGVGYFEEQGARAASGVINGGGTGGAGGTDGDDLGHDAADFGGSVELALALATFGGEVAHEEFVGVAEDAVAIGAVAGKIKVGFSKMAMRLVRRSTISLPSPSLEASLKSGRPESLLAATRGAMIFFLIWSPMSGLPLRATMSRKVAPAGMVMGA